VIYPIALRDRLEVLLTLPSGVFRTTVPVGAEAYEREVRAFRALLTKRTTRQYLPHAQQLFDWLVRPWLERLEGLSVQTLVFVPDALLRNVPVAALHDGERHLVERFSVAVTPGLDLTDPRPLHRQDAAALLGGISEPVAGFARLENVAEELRSIAELFPPKSCSTATSAQAFEQRLRGGLHSRPPGHARRVRRRRAVLHPHSQRPLDARPAAEYAGWCVSIHRAAHAERLRDRAG
jgi:CHAT domain-containing protein